MRPHRPHPVLRRGLRSLRASGRLAILLALVLSFTGCSLRRFAVNRVGDILSSGTSSAFENDSDLELVGDALPFSLKLLESLIAESPHHLGLRLTACRGFVLYAYGWVDFPADVAWESDYQLGRKLNLRARHLYLRAHDHCLAGLESLYPGISARLHDAPEAALAEVGAKPKTVERDLPFLYWTAASLGLAISSSRSDVSLLARLPEADALAHRALELDPDWGEGALHELEMSLLSASISGADLDAIKQQYQQALQLSQGKDPALFVSYAELVAVPRQDAPLFRSLLQRALAIDPTADPDTQLEATLAQRRATWLLGRIDDLILGAGEAPAEAAAHDKEGVRP